MTTLLYHARSNGVVCNRIAAASEEKVVTLCDKGELPTAVNGCLVRWDSKALLNADETINTAEAVKLSRNKRRSRMLLKELAPPTWFKQNEVEYPCVVRPWRHCQGWHYYVCEDKQELQRVFENCLRDRKWYATKLIEKVKEYRVFVFRDDAFKVVRRIGCHPSLPWNTHWGNDSIRVIREHWPSKVVEVACQAMKRLGVDFGAVDVIVDANRPYVLEVNTAPGIARQKTLIKIARLLGGA